MKMQMMIRNAKGVGMVEVLMAIAISGGLAMTVAKLMENTSQNTKQNEAKSEGINLKGIVQTILTNTTACTNTFSPIITQGNLTTLSGSPSATVAVPNIKDKTNTIKYSTASTDINPLTITSLSLTNYNSGAGTADLLIQLTFRRSASIVQMVKPVRIPLNFNINNTVPATPVLVGCSTMAVGGEWMLGGNAGTVDGTDYLGTSDNIPLNFKVNAQKAGRIDSVGQTFMGYQAGNALTTGLNNTAFGFRALLNNTTGNANTAIGQRALQANTTGQQNVAMGQDTLVALTTANWNTAVGNWAMSQNTTGVGNSAFGGSAMNYLTTGSNNVGLGWAAGYGIRTGSNNIGIGQNTLNAFPDGSNNVAIGQFAMNGGAGPHPVTTSSENTAVGSWALHNSSEGSYNVALGTNAGVYNRSGNYNTYLGYRTGAYAANLSGSRNIFIGSFAGNSSSGANTTNVATASDRLYINNGLTNVPLIEGDFTSAGRFVRFDASGIFGATNTNNSALKNNVIVGNSNTLAAGSNGSFIQGHNNNGSNVTFIAGVGNTTSQWLTHAMGQGNTVNGSASMAFGWNNNVSGQRSFSMGSANSVTADYSILLGIDSSSTHSGAMVLSDYGSSGADSWGYDTFTARFMGGYRLHTDSAGNTGVQLSAGGSSWGTISDRNAKENFIEIDPEEHLKKIAKLPVFKWNYIGKSEWHMGPMAQDFKYIFKLGDNNDKMITTQEMEGVTIVAVKALEARTRKLAQENEDLKKRIERLEALILKQAK